MSFLSEATLPDTFGPYEAFRRSLGFVPSLFRAQGLLPRAVEAQAAIRSAVLVEPGALSRVHKEKILLAAAAASRSRYCAALRSRVLGVLGAPAADIEALASGRRADHWTASEAGLVEFSRKLCLAPTSIEADDIDRLRSLGLADEEILEAVLTTGYNSLLCTLAAGVGAVPDSEPASVSPAEPPALAAPERASGPEQSGRHLRAPDKSPADFAPFVFLQKSFGFVPRVYRAQTLKPRAIEAEAQAIRDLLLPEGLLTRKQKEYILLAVSAANRNTYFVAVHGRILQMLGVPPEVSDRVALDHHQAELAEADATLLDAAQKLAARPGEFGAADVERLRRHGFREEQIIEAIAMAALTCFLNTVQMGLGAVPDFRPRRDFAAEPSAVNLLGATGHPTGDAEKAPAAADPDGELVARARRGDMNAFESLVRGHQGRVYRTVMGIAGNAEDAEDGTQAVFIKVFRKLGDFGGESRFSTWLTRIAINEGLERVRSRRPMDSLNEETDQDFRPSRLQPWVEDPESRFAREEMRRIVEEALARLPAAYRTAVLLRDIEQLSGPEAAAALGIPLPTLKTRLLRGRLMLREALAAHFTAPGRQSLV